MLCCICQFNLPRDHISLYLDEIVTSINITKLDLDLLEIAYSSSFKERVHKSYLFINWTLNLSKKAQLNSVMFVNGTNLHWWIST